MSHLSPANPLKRFYSYCKRALARYDLWLARNGLDKPCRSCIPREHDKQD
ncbi:hypothetical protein [Aliagarivorans taiwanensis]|nr:hypothetical protein [Aliagarivorans taiwanensis]